jgi:hypothetical protein
LDAWQQSCAGRKNVLVSLRIFPTVACGYN